jgi:hypothetical protein
MINQLDDSLKGLDSAVAEPHPGAVLRMTHPRVELVASLAFALTLGQVGRFERSKQAGVTWD